MYMFRKTKKHNARSKKIKRRNVRKMKGGTKPSPQEMQEADAVYNYVFSKEGTNGRFTVCLVYLNRNPYRVRIVGKVNKRIPNEGLLIQFIDMTSNNEKRFPPELFEYDPNERKLFDKNSINGFTMKPPSAYTDIEVSGRSFRTPVEKSFPDKQKTIATQFWNSLYEQGKGNAKNGDAAKNDIDKDAFISDSITNAYNPVEVAPRSAPPPLDLDNGYDESARPPRTQTIAKISAAFQGHGASPMPGSQSLHLARSLTPISHSTITEKQRAWADESDESDDEDNLPPPSSHLLARGTGWGHRGGRKNRRKTMKRNKRSGR